VKLILTCYRELLVTDLIEVFWTSFLFLIETLFKVIFKPTFV
jgi:hypothetical protein